MMRTLAVAISIQVFFVYIPRAQFKKQILKIGKLVLSTFAS